MNVLNNRILSYFTLVVLSACFVACSSDHFSVKGRITDAGTQNVRVVYGSDEGFEATWVTVKDDHFVFTGSSEEPVVLYVFNQQKKLLVHALVKNGDDVEIEGSLSAPYRMVVKGTDENEQWSGFLIENSKFFDSEDFQSVDRAIEKFIAENPDNVVSALLLTNDYSNLTDRRQVETLLGKLSIEARPESIMKYFYAMQAMQGDESKKDRIQSMQLYSSRDSIETVAPYKYSMNLLYFWNPDDKMRYSDFANVKNFVRELNSKRLQVADINLDSDTLRWKSIVRNDSAKWVRYWAVGGVMNSYLHNLKLTSTPYYIVADSTGKQVYQGDSFAAARKAVEDKLTKRK